MPKDTFLNLKEEKKERILNAALEDIAAYGYDKASVTRIVKRAGIATGSFYQYFEDLDDLFLYIAKRAGSLKARYMQEALAEYGRDDLESCIRSMYLGGLRFGIEHEAYFKSAQSLMQLQGTPLFKRMISEAEHSDLVSWLYKIVGQAIENGEMHEGITPELFFKLLTGINSAIIEYLIAQKPSGRMTEDDLRTLCDLGVHLVLRGISRTPQ